MTSDSDGADGPDLKVVKKRSHTHEHEHCRPSFIHLCYVTSSMAHWMYRLSAYYPAAAAVQQNK